MSEDNVIDFVSSEPKQPPLLVGPFEKWHVMVDGRIIPGLTGFREGESHWLVVDRRFACGPFPTEELARQAAICAPQMAAVASGYAHLGAETKGHPFAPQGMQLGEVPKERR